MGSDIHGVIEGRNHFDRVWRRMPYDFPDARNYDVFAVLADVRNGNGFAGVKTSDGFEVIAPQRGLPADATVTEDGDDPWMGDHSYSWLTLREIVEFDWLRTVTKYGIVPLRAWKGFQMARAAHEKDPRPHTYCGSISGPGIVTLDPEDAAERFPTWKEIDQAEKRGESIHVQDSWSVSYLSCCNYFLGQLVPLVKYGLDDIRLVFGFDS